MLLSFSNIFTQTCMYKHVYTHMHAKACSTVMDKSLIHTPFLSCIQSDIYKEKRKKKRVCTCVCVCSNPSMYHYDTQCVMGQGNTSSLILTLLDIPRLGIKHTAHLFRNTCTHNYSRYPHIYINQRAFTHSYSFL